MTETNKRLNNLGLMTWRVMYGTTADVPALTLAEAFANIVPMSAAAFTLPTCLQRVWLLPDNQQVVLWSHTSKLFDTFETATREFSRKCQVAMRRGSTFDTAAREAYWQSYLERHHIAPYLLSDTPPLEVMVTALAHEGNRAQDTAFTTPTMPPSPTLFGRHFDNSPIHDRILYHRARSSEKRDQPTRWTFASKYHRQQTVHGTTVTGAMLAIIRDNRREAPSSKAPAVALPVRLRLLAKDTRTPSGEYTRTEIWRDVHTFIIDTALQDLREGVLGELRERHISHRSDGSLTYLIERLPPWVLFKFEHEWLPKIFPQCFQAKAAP